MGPCGKLSGIGGRPDQNDVRPGPRGNVAAGRNRKPLLRQCGLTGNQLAWLPTRVQSALPSVETLLRWGKRSRASCRCSCKRGASSCKSSRPSSAIWWSSAINLTRCCIKTNDLATGLAQSVFALHLFCFITSAAISTALATTSPHAAAPPADAYSRA